MSTRETHSVRRACCAAATVLVLLAAPALVACGGSGTPAGTSPAATASPAAATASPAGSAVPLPAATVTGTFAFAKINEAEALGDIYLINADGTGLKQLAAQAGHDLGNPAWSPDGERIAYARSIGETNTHTEDYAVWVMDADGSGQRRLTNGTDRGFWPAWSPDGSQLAFRRTALEGGMGIYRMDADGSGVTRVTGRSADDSPRWAPSDRIMFVRDGADVFSVDPDGRGLSRVTKGANATAFALSPDRTQLVVYDAANDRIELLPADGGGAPVMLVDQVAAKGYVPSRFGAAYGVALTWAPDGKAIAFAANGNMQNSGSALYVVNVDGTGLSVVPNTGMIWEPAWRPE